MRWLSRTWLGARVVKGVPVVNADEQFNSRMILALVTMYAAFLVSHMTGRSFLFICSGSYLLVDGTDSRWKMWKKVWKVDSLLTNNGGAGSYCD